LAPIKQLIASSEFFFRITPLPPQSISDSGSLAIRYYLSLPKNVASEPNDKRSHSHSPEPDTYHSFAARIHTEGHPCVD